MPARRSGILRHFEGKMKVVVVGKRSERITFEGE
jgi:hypothetical protein